MLATGIRDWNAKLPKIGNGIWNDKLSTWLKRGPSLATSVAGCRGVGQLDSCVSSRPVRQRQFRFIERSSHARRKHDHRDEKRPAHGNWIRQRPIVQNFESPSPT